MLTLRTDLKGSNCCVRACKASGWNKVYGGNQTYVFCVDNTKQSETRPDLSHYVYGLSAQPRPDGAVGLCDCIKLKLLQMHLIHLSWWSQRSQNLLTDLPVQSDKSSLPTVPSADLNAARSTSDSNRSYKMTLGVVFKPPGNSRQEEFVTLTKNVLENESRRTRGKAWRVNKYHLSACF